MTTSTPPQEALPESERDVPSKPVTPTRASARPPTDDGPLPTPPVVIMVSHDLLFAPEAPACDCCGERITAEEQDEDGGAPGHGLYLWMRHGQRVYEEPPLCAACASAITITALLRWEMEEEEG
jgi:hypothetical protein